MTGRNISPAFIKPKDGSSSINAFRVETEEELKIYAGHVADYIVQPFVGGREYTIDIFCNWDGEPLSIVPRERLQVRAGEVSKSKICMDEIMIKEGKKLCEAYKPCGPLTVQLIRDSQGTDWFLEINPRYGGGAPLSMKAGARSAETVLRLLDGERVEYQSDTNIADGAIYSRFEQSVCIQEGRSKIKGVIFDLDDTLYSEKEYVRSGYHAVSEFLGGGFEDKLWNYYEEQKPAIDELLKEIGQGDKKESILRIYRTHTPNIHLYPDAQEIIRKLKADGKRVGIITDGRPEGQRKKIAALGLDVDDVIITDELGGIQFRKPCDIAFRILQTRWRLPASEMVYVADNPAKDFQAPRQLGMKCVWFRNKDGMYSNVVQDKQVEPNVSSLVELMKELE